MNRPKNPPLLAALVLVAVVLGVGACWALWDLAERLDARGSVAANAPE